MKLLMTMCGIFIMRIGVTQNKSMKWKIIKLLKIDAIALRILMINSFSLCWSEYE